MNKAYNEYQAKSRENEQENMFSKEEWKDEMAKKSPQFQNWSSLLTLEVICLRLIRAFQKGDFPTYIEWNYIPTFFCVSHKFDVDSFSDVFHCLTEHTVIHELDKVFLK